MKCMLTCLVVLSLGVYQGCAAPAQPQVKADVTDQPAASSAWVITESDDGPPVEAPKPVVSELDKLDQQLAELSELRRELEELKAERDKLDQELQRQRAAAPACPCPDGECTCPAGHCACESCKQLPTMIGFTPSWCAVCQPFKKAVGCCKNGLRYEFHDDESQYPQWVRDVAAQPSQGYPVFYWKSPTRGWRYFTGADEKRLMSEYQKSLRPVAASAAHAPQSSQSFAGLDTRDPGFLKYHLENHHGVSTAGLNFEQQTQLHTQLHTGQRAMAVPLSTFRGFSAGWSPGYRRVSP